MNKVGHKVGDIWKDNSHLKYKWCVQYPNGIYGFKTKEEAKAWRDQLKANKIKKMLSNALDSFTIFIDDMPFGFWFAIILVIVGKKL